MRQATNRRQWLHSSLGTCGALYGSFLALDWLPPLRSAELNLDPSMVKFHPDIEPLVRLIEETPRETIIEKIVDRIRQGCSYREILTATFLAGIRNVQPRPNVGFKFHSVLAIHATHQSSLAAGDRDRWLPLLWAVDNFKKAQADDVAQGDWTMKESPTSTITSASRALSELREALDRWDVERADRAASIAARSVSVSQLFDLYAHYGTRDFRDIGHKAIFVAGAFRLIDTIGGEHIEPILRSLTYAILCHNGESNPGSSDLVPDRPGRLNWEKVKGDSKDWEEGTANDEQTKALIHLLRESNFEESVNDCQQRLNRGLHPQSVWDAILTFSSELVARQSAIVPLHAVTASNAIHFLYRNVHDPSTRRWLLLQNVSFVTLFREAAKSRGKLRDIQIDQWDSATLPDSEKGQESHALLEGMDQDRNAAALRWFRYLEHGNSPSELIRSARANIFRKGTDSHDYKFSAACLEDFEWISPKWRNRYLAGCSYLLLANDKPDTNLSKRVTNLLS